MSRPSSIWFAFAACALLGLGALVVVSRHSIQLEKDSRAAAMETEVAQRTRLALWRMDSEAAALLMRENNRAPSEFRQPGRPDNAPAAAQIYFELDESGLLVSACPDNPVTKERMRRMLGVGDARIALRGGNDYNGNPNMDLAYAVANGAVIQQQKLAAPDESVDKEGRKDESKPSDGNDDKGIARDNRDGFQSILQSDVPPQIEQVLPNQAEDDSQMQVQGKPMGKDQKASYEPKSKAYRAVEDNKTAALKEFNERAKLVQQSNINRYASGNAPSFLAQGSGNGVIMNDCNGNGLGGASPALAWIAPDTGVTSLQPVWIDKQLLLVRAIGSGERQRVQGIWLDHALLSSSLLDGIQDLLPHAALLPYEPFVFTRENVIHAASAAGLGEVRLKATPRMLENAPMALLSLPWELEPGRLVSAIPGSDSPLRLLLGLAWGGAALAIIAAGLLLRGVLTMSERRAAFVSAVTHELRTPLTTFTLYSEMLADGMIRDQDKQQDYLRTLQRESGRLGHLVENVLAYSRLERGSARSRLEEVTVASLVDRLLPRLRERAESVSAGLDYEVPPTQAATTVRTDIGVVEQIIFNLVDNAAKYAPPAPGRPGKDAWQLKVSANGQWLHLDFVDHGPGISRNDRRKLFRPFHKSAEEAANSKPGVGLGLALSRRLAKALGGRLSLLQTGPEGTVFRLSLPLGK